MSFSNEYLDEMYKVRRLIKKTSKLSDKALKKVGVKRKTPFEKYKEKLAKHKIKKSKKKTKEEVEVI